MTKCLDNLLDYFKLCGFFSFYNLFLILCVSVCLCGGCANTSASTLLKDQRRQIPLELALQAVVPA